MPIVKQILREVLPAGTRVEAGEAGLYSEVSWVVALRPSPPGFDVLKGNELAVIGAGVASGLGVTLSFLISELAERKVSAICIQGEITDDSRREAQSNGLPLIRIPSQINLNSLETDVIQLISEERQVLYQKEREFSQSLMELAVAGYGRTSLLKKLQELTGRSFGFFDLNFKSFFPINSTPDSTIKGIIQPVLLKLRNLPFTGNTTVVGIKLTQDQAGFLGAVRVGRDIKGYLLAIAPDDESSESDRMVVRVGALALAIETSRRQAVEETEDRFEENIIETLISGDAASPGMEEKIKKLNSDLSLPFVALIASPLDSASEHTGIMRQVIALLPGSLTCIHGGNLVVLNPLKREASKAELQLLGKKLAGGLTNEMHTTPTLGIGRAYSGTEGIRRSFQEAEQALTMGLHFYGKGSITGFGDLGVHRLLFSLKSAGELKVFYNEFLGKLIEYERQPAGELEQTLKTYLQYNSVAETARVMHVHRNTLLYRLSRIQEITGLDLEDGETRLALYLAILAGEVIRTH
jgi:PucR family transcriptional regulator, purine catabolism regulatory protein